MAGRKASSSGFTKVGLRAVAPAMPAMRRRGLTLLLPTVRIQELRVRSSYAMRGLPKEDVDGYDKALAKTLFHFGRSLPEVL